MRVEGWGLGVGVVGCGLMVEGIGWSAQGRELPAAGGAVMLYFLLLTLVDVFGTVTFLFLVSFYPL